MITQTDEVRARTSSKTEGCPTRLTGTSANFGSGAILLPSNKMQKRGLSPWEQAIFPPGAPASSTVFFSLEGLGFAVEHACLGL
jgi:hypothetical protein